jgi:hypothetical protein
VRDYEARLVQVTQSLAEYKHRANTAEVSNGQLLQLGEFIGVDVATTGRIIDKLESHPTARERSEREESSDWQATP